MPLAYYYVLHDQLPIKLIETRFGLEEILFQHKVLLEQ